MSDEYNKKSNQIRQLAAMPQEQLTDHLSQLHDTINSVAPNIMPHIHATAINAIQFLNSKLPTTGNQMVQDRVVPLSEVQKRQWLNLHSIVDDPIKILDHVNNGTLNNQHLELMHSIFPDIHREMADKLRLELGSLHMKNKQLPYAKRQSIAKFISEPIDSTMTQQAAQAIILSSTATTAKQQQMNKQHKASSTELTQIDKVNKMALTSTQANELNDRK